MLEINRIRITWDAAACAVSSAITRAIIDNNWLRDFMLATRPNKPITNNYNNNESKADSIYTGQLIEVFGKVKSISADGSNKSLMLETNDLLFGIDCAIDSTYHDKLKSLTEGQDITIRGECSGILSDVVMVRCIIL
ncbi:MAG: OB-fold protein [Bacteroidota bacterium]